MPDRIAQLRANDTSLTGLDYVHVVPGSLQRTLQVYFHTDPRNLSTPFDPALPGSFPLSAADLRVEATSDELAPVTVDAAVAPTWLFDATAGRPYLQLRVQAPGSFGRYLLRITDPRATTVVATRIDPYFAAVSFSFKVECAENLDCWEVELGPCAPEPDPAITLDYLARDFPSLRQALDDYVRAHHEGWQPRTQADPMAVMLDLLAHAGDELSYLQDRLVQQSTLPTATERRSLRHLARLVDYEIHDGRCASTELVIRVAAGAGAALVLAGAQATAVQESTDGAGEGVITFEVGRGFVDQFPFVRAFVVHEQWNQGQLRAFFFDDRDAELDCGVTAARVRGPVPGIDTWPLESRRILVEQPPASPGEPVRRQLLTVTRVVGEDDTGATPLVDPLTGVAYHEVHWVEGLEFRVDLRAARWTANLVPAIAGRTVDLVVRCGDRAATAPALVDPDWVVPSLERDGPLPPRAPERCGAQAAVATRPTLHRAFLPGTEQRPLGFVGADLRATQPELLVREVTAGHDLRTDPDAASVTALEVDRWEYRPTLLESDPNEQHVTLEDGSWGPVATHRGPSGTHVHRDYMGSRGATVRWGEGTFARRPAPGTRFRITYRLSDGARANLAADTITRPGPGIPAAVAALSNPLAVTDGVDPETALSVRRFAPVAWRDRPLFALRTEDYAAQAERLDRVERAAAELRWTGSWPTVRVAADPVGTTSWSRDLARDLHQRLACVKQAGRDVVAATPRFVALDLDLILCILPGHDPARVVAGVRAVLVGPREDRGEPFFSPSNFTFGTPLERSRLDAAVLSVPGVYSILSIDLGARGMRRPGPWTGMSFSPGSDGVIRLDASRARPENGSLFVTWRTAP